MNPHSATPSRKPQDSAPYQPAPTSAHIQSRAISHVAQYPSVSTRITLDETQRVATKRFPLSFLTPPSLCSPLAFSHSLLFLFLLQGRTSPHAPTVHNCSVQLLPTQFFAMCPHCLHFFCRCPLYCTFP